MKIEYLYSTTAIILFEDGLEKRISGTLQEIVEVANYFCDTYGFERADVVDAETGEVLAILSEDNEKEYK